VQDRENKLNARLSKAEAKCGTSGSSDSTVSSGSGGNTGTTAG
jgi:hypothetical protein